MKDTIVLFPVMGRSHLVPMVELAKFITTHHHTTLSVILLLPSPPDTATPEYISTVSSDAASPNSLIFHHLSPSQPLLHTLQSSKPKAFILDFFNHSAANVAAELHIPTYYYFPNAASCVALLLYFPTIHHLATATTTNYVDILQSVPGLPPLSPEDMPDPIMDRRSHNYESFLKISTQMRKTNGFIVNTFEKLEPKAIMALKSGACTPEETHAPFIFCVGPLISSVKDGGNEGNSGSNDEWLDWLDSQPSRSVVYLCFGSHQGRFSNKQINEIAIALEKSEQRFLWVVKNPKGYYENQESTRLEELLPKGFLERTKEKGRVVRNWAPQVEILSHDSVGGFVTHCGWNSVAEAISFGVPMVAWPLYAEQRMNRVVMVVELKVALPLKEEEGGFVTASELEGRVREVLDSERGRGKEVRERVLGFRKEAVAAMSDGGSSRVALNELVDFWMHN